MDQPELFPSQIPRRRKKQPQEWKVVSLRECPSPESLQMCDTPEKCDEYLTRVMMAIEELEGRFADFEEFVSRLTDKREEAYIAFGEFGSRTSTNFILPCIGIAPGAVPGGAPGICCPESSDCACDGESDTDRNRMNTMEVRNNRRICPLPVLG